MSLPAVATHPLVDALTPLPGRLIVEEPRAVAAPKRTMSGLYLAAHSERTRRTAGLVTRVLKCARDVEQRFAHEGVRAGAWVYVPEFAGTPLLAADGGATGYWVIGAGDLIAVLDSPEAVAYAEGA